MPLQQKNLLFKVVLAGPLAVGKTNILTRYIRDEFDLESIPTKGVEFVEGKVEEGSHCFKLHLWDIGGKRRPRAACQAYYRNAFGVILVYDITRRDTFVELDRWLDEIDEFSHPDIVRVLVGNKCDLTHLREVEYNEGQEYARQNDLLFFESSALDYVNIDEMFRELAVEIFEYFNAESLVPTHQDSSERDRRTLLEPEDIASLGEAGPAEKLSSSAEAASVGNAITSYVPRSHSLVLPSGSTLLTSSSSPRASSGDSLAQVDAVHSPGSGFAAPVKGFEVYVYFDANSSESVESAKRLRMNMAQSFPHLAIYNMHYKAAGVHPSGMWEAHLQSVQDFGMVIPWLCVRRGSHSVLIRPQTGRTVLDFSSHAIWLGQELELSL